MWKVKEVLPNFCIVFISILVVCGICEWFVRHRGTATNFIQYNEHCGSILRPNAEGLWRKEGFAHVKINSKGLRDYEYEYKKPDNVFRILILGDSFTTAFQVELEQTFHKILERLLNNSARTTKDIEVINVSQPNYGTAEEYLRLKFDGIKYEPDLIILAFYIGNDFRNNSPDLDRAIRPFFILKDGQLHLDDSYKIEKQYKDALMGYSHPLRRFSRFLLRHSHSYRFVRTRLNLLRMQLTHNNSKAATTKEHQLPLDYEIFSSDLDNRWKNTMEVTKALMLGIKRISNVNGADFLLLSIPMGEQVHDESRKMLIKKYPNEKSWNFERPDRILSKFCQANNINYLPILSQFRHNARQTGRMLYFNNYNGHLTAEGHELLAEIIFEELTTKPEMLTNHSKQPSSSNKF